MKVLGLMLMIAGLAGTAFAGLPAPEVDSNSAYAAVTLLSGGLLILRARRKK